MTNSKIERFELNEQAAIALIVIIASMTLLPPASAYLIAGIAGIIFILSLEIHFTFLLFLVLIGIGSATSITHQSILGLDGSFYYVLSGLLFTFGLYWHAVHKNFHWNKLFIGLSLIIVQLGIFETINHTSLFGSDGRLTIALGYILLVIAYLFRFFLKEKKSLIDILKVGIVISVGINSISRVTHQTILGFDWSYISSPLIFLWALSYFTKYLPNDDDDKTDILDYDLEKKEEK